ncbi:hypothetical protein [Bacillus sp. FJAT-27264]|nr:hypothetical protein [Bacillus sp. FJAT-27264]
MGGTTGAITRPFAGRVFFVAWNISFRTSKRPTGLMILEEEI